MKNQADGMLKVLNQIHRDKSWELEDLFIQLLGLNQFFISLVLLAQSLP